jgi:ubiquitin C-terminal hydrolase
MTYFGGVYLITMKCLKCNHKTFHFDRFLNLEIDIPNDNLDIQNLMDISYQEELIEGVECQICKKKQKVLKVTIDGDDSVCRP